MLRAEVKLHIQWYRGVALRCRRVRRLPELPRLDLRHEVLVVIPVEDAERHRVHGVPEVCELADELEVLGAEEELVLPVLLVLLHYLLIDRVNGVTDPS